MKTLLTKYSLYLYGLQRNKPLKLCSGTTNQIIQWRKINDFITDDNIRKAYGRNCYTVVYEGD